MTIQERIRALSKLFADMHHQSLKISEKRSRIKQDAEGAMNRERARWNRELAAVEDVEANILKFYRVAKDNSRAELIPPQQTYSLTPDLDRLNEMVYRINVENLDDYCAGQMIDLCSHYLAHTYKQKQAIKPKLQAALSAVEQQTASALHQVDQEQEQLLYQVGAHLRGSDVAELVRLFGRIHHTYEITPMYYSDAMPDAQRMAMMLVGFYKIFVDVPRVSLSTMKQMFGDYFDPNEKLIDSPLGFNVRHHQVLRVEYNHQNETALKGGVQALLINMLRYLGPRHFRVTVLDTVHYNADLLGELHPLCTAEHPLVEVARDEQSMRKMVTRLNNDYQALEKRLGSRSVFEYNASAEEKDRIQLRVLIINQEMNNVGYTNDALTASLVNNAERYGLFVLDLTKHLQGGSKGTRQEDSFCTSEAGVMQLISDKEGHFYCWLEQQWCRFRWNVPACKMNAAFMKQVMDNLETKKIGNNYTARYKLGLPKRAAGKRRPVQIPFGVDENDQAILYRFETNKFDDTMFAAYISGAAGSGKSTLLHSIISGIISGYHPDEVELWLMDFKMVEFKRYINNRPPHVKYLLLEKSQELVFDIIDKLMDELMRRQKLFAKNNWNKLRDVPLEVYMPAIFVIVDEFGQMSQILKETRGSGADTDYALKLESLLRLGRGLGFRFIFSDQVYANGGLTDNAAKQIQGWMALMNKPDEMKAALYPVPSALSDRVNEWIATMPPYHTLFKWKDDQQEVRVNRYSNLYLPQDEMDKLLVRLSNGMKPAKTMDLSRSDTYLEKHPVLIDGTGRPDTFDSLKPEYISFEQQLRNHTLPEGNPLRDEELFSGDMLIYPGVPRSFDKVKPFILKRDNFEHILLVSSQREGMVSVALSVAESFQRKGRKAEVWAHRRSATFSKYAACFDAPQYRTADEICARVRALMDDVKQQNVREQMVIMFGCSGIFADLENAGVERHAAPAQPAQTEASRSSAVPDLSSVMKRIREATTPEEKKRIRDEYNRLLAEQNSEAVAAAPATPAAPAKPAAYDAREDIRTLLRKAGEYGIHFMFCLEKAQEVEVMHINEKHMIHKIAFNMPKGDTYLFSGCGPARDLEKGVFLYTNGGSSGNMIMKPHLHPGIANAEWMVDANGRVVPQT